MQCVRRQAAAHASSWSHQTRLGTTCSHARSCALHCPALQALEIDAFVQRIMPPLLEQNYQRNTGARRGSGSAPAAGAGFWGGRGDRGPWRGREGRLGGRTCSAGCLGAMLCICRAGARHEGCCVEHYRLVFTAFRYMQAHQVVHPPLAAAAAEAGGASAPTAAAARAGRRAARPRRQRHKLRRRAATSLLRMQRC